MPRTIALLAAAVLPLSGATASLADDPPACRQIRGMDTPDESEDDVFVCREAVWFHHGASPQLGNSAAFGEGHFPSWDTTEPAGSVDDGAGGLYVASSALHQLKESWDPRMTPRFEGRFTGEIDTLGISFYMAGDPAHIAQGAQSFRTNLRLLVDDKEVFVGSDVAIPMVPEPAAFNHRLDFALVNVFGVLEGMEGLCHGPKCSHRVTLSVVGTGLATNGAVFRYDSVEYPAGIVFNIEPGELNGYTTIDLGPEPAP